MQTVSAYTTRDGDWEGWLDFFLDGLATIADEAVDTARDLFTLVAADRQRVLDQEGVNLVALRLFERLPRRPIVTAGWVVEAFGTSKPTAGRALAALEGAGVLVESTGKKRDRSYTSCRWSSSSSRRWPEVAHRDG